MKRYLLNLPVLALLIMGSLPLAAQDFDLNVKADTILVPGGKCNIILTVTGGLAPFTYMLYDNEPWDGGKLIEKSVPSNEISYTFTISTAGRFLLAVRDNNGLTKIIPLNIKAAGSVDLIFPPGSRRHLFVEIPVNLL